jgi:hypothetical protein
MTFAPAIDSVRDEPQGHYGTGCHCDPCCAQPSDVAVAVSGADVKLQAIVVAAITDLNTRKIWYHGAMGYRLQEAGSTDGTFTAPVRYTTNGTTPAVNNGYLLTSTTVLPPSALVDWQFDFGAGTLELQPVTF